MNILEFIILRSILNIECSGKTVTEIMAGTGLQRFTVMHQCFDGICCNGAREFFLFGLSALDYGNRKHILAEIRIYV